MFIELSEFNIKLLIPLIFPLFRHIQDLTNEAYMKKDGDSQIFVTFRYFLSYLFGGIFLIILKYRTRNKIERKETESGENELINKNVLSEIDLTAKEQEKKRIIKSILFLLLLCGLVMSTFYCRYFFYRDDFFYAEQSTRAFCEIVTFTTLSYFIIKQKLYIHHFISLGCITFMLLIIFIISIPFIERIFYSFLYYFLIALAFALYDVLTKK